MRGECDNKKYAKCSGVRQTLLLPNLGACLRVKANGYPPGLGEVPPK